MVCIFCGSQTHNYRSCPISYAFSKKAELTPKQDYFGKAPNVFIGRHGYPHVRVGILGTEHYEKHDEPLTWSREGTPIPEIVRLRSSLVNSYFASTIKSPSGEFASLTQEVSVAKRPVDVEIGLKSAPKPKLTMATEAAPHGPNVPLALARITENVPIDTRVDKAVAAQDLRAGEALTSLSRKGVDPYFLTKAFSMGNFGLPLERKLVPTRWSITAVDDMLAKQRLDELRKCQESDCLAYFGGHLGNYYLILCFDSIWEYELFEQYWPSDRTSIPEVETDYEPHAGRKDYVHETAGGYYAARIGIVNSLLERRRQAAVLAIRIITDEYTTPLGVWVVREAVKKALATEPLKFGDRTLLLQYGTEFLKRKFGYDLTPLLKQSHLVKSLFGQKRLSEY